MSRQLLAFVTLCTLFALKVTALSNGLAKSPPMGWSSWNTFACDVNETVIKQIADVMVRTGMRDVGYEYVNIDDCWMRCSNRSDDGDCQVPQEGRDANGQLVADPIRFPSGIKALADYVHSKGLKFGIYSSSGPLTCSNFWGSWDHFEIDANTFAEWGVDYVKLDCCNTTKAMKDQAYPELSRALLAAGRPMVYSCDTDELFANPMEALQSGEKPWQWAPNSCNLWRTGPDIKDTWFRMWLNAHLNDLWWFGESISSYSGPGGWNDPDMLVVGMGGQSDIQYRTHFSLWAIMAAPLIAGNNLLNMTNSTIEILTTKEIIAVDQDPLGIQGKRITGILDVSEVWVKPLADESKAVLLANMNPIGTEKICVSWSQLGWDSDTNAIVRDLWAQRDLGSFSNQFCQPDIPIYGSVMLKITPTAMVNVM